MKLPGELRSERLSPSENCSTKAKVALLESEEGQLRRRSHRCVLFSNILAVKQAALAALKRFPNRFRLIHLKDVRKGTPIGEFSITAVSSEASVPLGTGILDIPAILLEAEKVGIKKYYVEDESAEPPREYGVFANGPVLTGRGKGYGCAT